MNWESIITIIGSVLGGGVVGALASAWVARYTAGRTADTADHRLTFDRDKWMSETQQELVSQAMGFLKPYEEENAKLVGRLIDLQQQAADCKAAINEISQTKDREIGMLQAKVTVLQNQIINLKGQNTQLRARVTELERKPNGSDFIDPPPSEDDPTDWQ